MPRVVARIGELAVAAGLLAAGLALPPALLAGSAVRDAAQTFDSLSVPQLTAIPSRSAILASDGSVIAYYYPDHIYRDPVSYSQIAP